MWRTKVGLNMESLSTGGEEKVDHADKTKDTGDTSGEPPRGEVLCDFCMDGPGKALKSCLTCQVSYCEAHLRPHRENSKFQSHRLVDPLHDVNSLTCGLHRLPLERFCPGDGCCLCLDCERQEHDGHQTVSLGEARAESEAEMQRKKEEISQGVLAAEQEITKLRSNNDSVKCSVQEVSALVEEQFARLQKAVEEARQGAAEVLEGERRQALSQAESIQTHLEQKKSELLKILSQMSKLTRSKSDVDFLQEYADWKKGIPEVCLPAVCVNRMDHLTSYVQEVTDATQKLCGLIRSTNMKTFTLAWKTGAKSQRLESQLCSTADPETREDFLKYARRLIFDPDTTHRFLRVTEGDRKLTNTSPWQHSYPDHPNRFEYWRQAMASESLYQGRHYIEAELSGEGAHVGLTRKSIERRGEQSSGCITGNDFSWCVGSGRRGLSAWHAGVETPLEVGEIRRLGLYVDFHRGTVSFYDASGSMRLLHGYTADLSEPLYVTAWLSKKDNVVHLPDSN
ncbi:tripartite motif-containing protein 16-like [Nelusetta ayraudi]|uniref:tripartite motif-containing protein 16-like n=1 Tax=Nelusetta ayraudi TaxID=303726 RepID=UPI003F722B5C